MYNKNFDSFIDDLKIIAFTIMILGLIFYVGGKKNVNSLHNNHHISNSIILYQSGIDDTSEEGDNEEPSGIIYDERQNQDSCPATIRGHWGIDAETGEQEEILLE